MNLSIRVKQEDFGEENLQSKGNPSRTESSNATRCENRWVRVVGNRCVQQGVARGDDDLEEEDAVEKKEEDCRE